MHRSSDSRVLAGVCGGISNATGIDVMLVRLAFVVLTVMSGVMALVYAGAWLIVPIDGESSNIFSRAVNDRRGIRIIIAMVPALIVMQIVVSVLHIGYIGLIGWPTFLAAALIVLIWRNTSEPERVWIVDDVAPMFGIGRGVRRWTLFVRVGLGVLLGVSSSGTPARRPFAHWAGRCWSWAPLWWSSGPGG
jgi:phage shock protein PspC (stress-responsive transcriptional regulator)